jgi:hypothetical protein
MTTRYEPFMIIISAVGLSGGNGTDFEQSVKWHLDLIRRSQTGRALLSGIQRTGKQFTIKPYVPTQEAPFNATADTTTLGEVEVFYTSTMWGYGGTAANAFLPGKPGDAPSAVLFHELAHAYRRMRGTNNTARVTTQQPGYENQEELFAIMLTNIFVTDPTTQLPVRTLRKDHAGFAQLNAAQSTSQGFLGIAENSVLMGQFWAEEFGLMTDLLHVNAGFNPIMQYYKLQYPNYSS